MGVFGFLRLPESPLPCRPIDVDESTSSGRLVVRTMFAVNGLTFPAAALMVVQQASQAAVPIVMGVAIDRGLASSDRGALAVWLAVLVGLFGVLAVSYRLAYRFEILAMQVVCYHLRLKLAAAILDPCRVTRELPGVGLSIFTTDAGRMGQAPGLLVYPFGDVVALAIVAVALLVLAWPLGVVVIVGTPLMMWVLDHVAGPLRRRSVGQLQGVADATATASDLVAGLRVIKGLGAEQVATRRYRRVSQEALQATLRWKSSQAAYEVTTDLVSGLFLAGVAILIGWLALRDQLTVGELVTAVGLAQFAIAPVRSLTKEFGTRLAEVKASALRVLGVLQAPRREAGHSAVIDTTTPRLELRDVRLGDLRGVDVTVEPGEIVAIVTDGGSAQLLEDVLMVRRPVVDGIVAIGGVPIDTMNDAALRSLLLVAPHAADLFDGTVLDNIEPGNETGVPTAAAATAITAAALEDVLEVLPNGLSSRVGEGGVMLSGGQRQRVALARAFATSAPILVLHEPTTAVDSVTESVIASHLRDVRRGVATILITTSPGLLAVADRVVWLRRDGRTVDGRHQDLLADDWYAEVFA